VKVEQDQGRGQWISLELSEEMRRQIHELDHCSKTALMTNYRTWFTKITDLSWEYVDEHFIASVQYRESIGYYWRVWSGDRHLVRLRDYKNYRIQWTGIHYMTEGRCCNWFEIVGEVEDDELSSKTLEETETTDDRFIFLEQIEDEIDRMFAGDLQSDQNQHRSRKLKKRRRIKRKTGERPLFLTNANI